MEVFILRAAMFLGTGVEEIEAVGIIDVLRRADVTVDLISISGSLQVDGSHNITLSANKLFYEMDQDGYLDYDMIILPGGPGTPNYLKNDDLCKLLVEFDKKKKWIAAICAAPTVLGKLGILKGKKATCYPGLENALEGCEHVDQRVVKSDNIITGKGPGVAMEFALEILTIFKSDEEIGKLRQQLIM